MTDYIGQAVERVLSSKPIHLAHPSSAGLTNLYADVTNSSSHLVETVNRNGAIRVASNNLSLSATSNFSVSSSMLVYNPMLIMAVTLPATGVMNDGWGLLAIDTIELSIPSSLAQNMVISGSAMREFLLYSQPDPEKRTDVLRQCGEHSAGAGINRACIPLAFLINRSYISNTFPIDMSTFRGFLQINVTFKSAQAFMTDNSANGGISFPTTFQNLELVFSNSSIADAGFSVRNSLSQPDVSYNIPQTWLSQYKYHITATPNAGAESTLTVTSAPKGMLQGFLFSVQPTAEIAGGATGTVDLFSSGVSLRTLRVEYNGQDIYRAESLSEIDGYSRYRHDGDNLSYSYSFYLARATNTINLMRSRVYFVPFNYHSSMVRSGHLLENLPSYDGATIQIHFTINSQGRIYTAKADPFSEAVLAVANAGTAQDFTCEVTWLVSALMEINQSSVDLQR